ncbi:AraC family transcriptional regulator [Paenibacillus doosanensis]|uniref:AraC family transcriptional regulator n=1 Tax=Paenibacillus doosanensis TaxID=1229154 RepID=UPI00217FDE86|nr:AraC family transcriptional regulator [Paenibacillus doosanensis]MCS7464424.1 AraC family transcriptional regulator [Paenibacillus doosanensis]
MDAQWTFQSITSTLQVTGCHFGIKPPGWSYPKYHHHLTELVYCIDGEVTQQIGQENVLMRRGDLLLIKSGIKHATLNGASIPYVFFNLHFDLDDSDMRRILGAEPYRRIPGDAASSSRVPGYIGELERLLCRGIADSRTRGAASEQHVSLDAGQRLAVQAHTLLLVSEVMDLLGQPDGHAEEAAGPVPDASHFAADVAHRIEDLLSQNVYSDITVAEIAQAMNMSRYQCSKVFAHVYGVSPRQFLSRLKLNEAKKLLVTTDKPVAAIAELLGFHSATHFSRQFRRWTGQAPQHYRPKQ